MELKAIYQALGDFGVAHHQIARQLQLRFVHYGACVQHIRGRHFVLSEKDIRRR